MIKLTDKEFSLIQEYVKKHYGINLNNDKKSLVYSRLRTTIAELEMDSFKEYYDYLVNDKTGQVASEFINRISTNHTFFMREKDHFDYLAKSVLPELEKTISSKDIKLWCAASSSGEEPYTLQIIMQDYFAGKGWNTQMIASDVSTKVLNIAYNGIYSAEALEVMPKAWVKKYFDKLEDDLYQVKDFIRKEILFRKINLMDEKLDKMFSKKLNIIFCRNVMIYFDEKTRDNLVNKMYNMLDTDGYLFVGHSERIDNLKTPFKYVMPALYKKMVR